MKFRVTKTYSTSVVVEADTKADALALANAYKAMHLCLRIRDDEFAGNKVEQVADDTEAFSISPLMGEESAPTLREEPKSPEATEGEKKPTSKRHCRHHRKAKKAKKAENPDNGQ
jgi:hypothetical protein